MIFVLHLQVTVYISSEEVQVVQYRARWNEGTNVQTHWRSWA